MRKVSLVSFSARKTGNCSLMADYIISKSLNYEVKYISINDLDIHECKNCNYECMSERCIYHNDDAYLYFQSTKEVHRIIWIVPMYCGNPSSLYFKLNERSQDFWMKNESYYDEFLNKLFIIGIGNIDKGNPFRQIFESMYSCSTVSSYSHILILETHKYGLNSIKDSLIANQAVKEQINKFLSL